jgi:hypothetical protein
MLRRPVTALLTLAVAAGLAVVPASSAVAAPSDTSVSIELRRTTTSTPAPGGRLTGVYYDSTGPAIAEDTFAVTGRLTEDTGGEGLAGQTVVLVRSKKTETTSRIVASTTTDAEGDYRFAAQRVVGSAAYLVAYEGDQGVTYNASDSMENADPVVVFGMRDLNATKRKVKGKLYFRGDVNPGWGGKKVTLQRKTCSTCSWRTVTSKAAGSRGAWSFRVGYPAKVGPVWRYQAVLAPSGDFEKSYSAQLTTRRVYSREASARLG